jgi:hypothetical protein
VVVYLAVKQNWKLLLINSSKRLLLKQQVFPNGCQ